MKSKNLALAGAAAVALFITKAVFHPSLNQVRGPSSFQSTSRNLQLYGFNLPLHDLEVVPEGEITAIDKANGAMLELFKKEYVEKGLPIRRGVHPKAHGCVHGSFEINSDLSVADRVGIFQPGAKHDVLIRFSNAGPRATQDDTEADSRGFAMKVLNVNGEHILNAQTGPSQDFTLNTTDTFFSDNAEHYSRFMQIAATESDNFRDAAQSFIIEMLPKNPVLGVRILKAFLKIKAVKPTTPLGLKYNSISAFQHGRGHDAPVVKFGVEPCFGPYNDPVQEGEKDFLRKNLRKTIEARSACFRFLVQHRTLDTMSVEDLTTPWEEADAPFVEVGRIHLPQQRLVDDATCEHVVINPWNALPEHRPIGGINRMRLGAYLMSISRRRGQQ